MTQIPDEVRDLSEKLHGGWWNYRLVEITANWTSKQTGNTYFEKVFKIYEVYYDNAGEIMAWSENPVDIRLESYKDWKDFKKSIDKAIKMPILQLCKDGDKEKLIRTNTKLKNIKPGYMSNFDFNAESAAWGEEEDDGE